jgi:effector-binding domain-containing protein
MCIVTAEERIAKDSPNIEKTEAKVEKTTDTNSAIATDQSATQKHEEIINDVFTLDEQTYQEQVHKKPITGIRRVFKHLFERVGLKIATTFLDLHDWISK